MSPRTGEQGREHASPRQERSSTQGIPPQRGTSAAEENRQRGTTGARAQDDDTMRGRAERSKASEQTGERSNDQARDRNERSGRDEARDNRQDRADQDRNRASSERKGDHSRNRDRADRDRNRDRDHADRNRANRDRDREHADRNRDRGHADRNRDRERTTTGQSTGDRATESRRSHDNARSDRDRNRDRADRGRDARGSVHLSQEQRTRISARFSDRIDRQNVRVLPRSRLSVSIGVVVPSSIRLYDVPADIVAIYPDFRSYKFVVVEDEIVIIEPRSRKVVTTISRSGERSASRSTTGVAASGSHVRLRAHDREVIRTVVMREAECRYETRIDFRIGLPLPRTVQICEFPDEVLAEVPDIRQYRYVVRGDDIVLVDPDEHRIVEVID
jgi:hypothetical protein